MKFTAATAATALTLLYNPVSAELSQCCGTGSSPPGNSGQGNDRIRVPLHRAGSRELVVGQTRQVPTTVVGSMAEIGGFLSSFVDSDLDTMKGEPHSLSSIAGRY